MIEELINFIIDLVNDEFSRFLYPVHARYYFLNGGCLELAKVLKHYYPACKIIINEKRNHILFLYQDKLYDATGELKLNIYEEIKDINLIEDYIGNKEVRFERKQPHHAIIEELESIHDNYVKKLTNKTSK